MRCLRLALTRRSQGPRRSSGAKASQQIAVGAKWIYKIATVKMWKLIQNTAAASKARPRSHKTTTAVSSAVKEHHCMMLCRCYMTKMAWPRPWGRRTMAQSKIELSGQLVTLQPPLRILVSADKK